ncbi:MAG: MCE family protein [Acidobacteria bacterium]|nr:MCE family protein [Acidobacteriota bacterium]
MNIEFRVGLLVIAAVAAMAYFVIRIENFGLVGDEDSYVINVRFDNASGIAAEDPVYVAGVNVGHVASVGLDMTDGTAHVRLRLRNDAQLYEDAVAIVGSSGMLGDRVLQLSVGSSDRPIVPPDGWISGGDPVSIDQMVTVVASIARNLESTTESISRVLGTEAGEASLREILTNIEALTGRLDNVLARNGGTIDSGISNFDRTLANLESLSSALGENLPALVEDMRGLSTELTELVEENRGDLSAVGGNLNQMTQRLDRSAADLEELIAKMNRGDGTVSRLVNESETVDRLNEALDSVDDTLAAADTFFRRVGETRFSFEWRSEFYDRISATKNYFGVRLELGEENAGRGFEFHLIDDNIGGFTETNTLTEFFNPDTGALIDRTLSRELTRKEGFQVNALITQRLGNFQMRGGILESQAGLGLDLFLADDKLRVTSEVWDIGRDPDPHLKFRAQWNIVGRFFLTGGWDDALRPDLRSYYLGGGYSFRQ